uniref:Uncharacterized protein n=1 Tax=Opuntia streptacantha TaxID=393608 RepID=A0A7C8YM22_OPUST
MENSISSGNLLISKRLQRHLLQSVNEVGVQPAIIIPDTTCNILGGLKLFSQQSFLPFALNVRHLLNPFLALKGLDGAINLWDGHFQLFRYLCLHYPQISLALDQVKNRTFIGIQVLAITFPLVI